MDSYEKRKLEELGFVNELLSRGVPADQVGFVTKMASLDRIGSANVRMFEQGMRDVFSKNAELVKRARKVTIIEDDPVVSRAADGIDSDEVADEGNEEDFVDKLKRWGLYAGIGTAGAIAGYAGPKLYNHAADTLHRMKTPAAGTNTAAT